mmetsp:Transcript_100141/g.279013  ORF Transcript_100141/g.279013 Transcript_100141/m.279013 type:complete len:105 (-) Transcript_100141:84-398(-)|eukprot:CAMPEP_0179061566 /NCGR_PEP_ID=MMETSP0796-20121207/26470_1 /TAXON_ID=73915 /ORGANISM="Pyrodinium bahamense, Strain pbaha01" /LENGTH=104 /DNA_ID=CAMNT_0020758429 /DNA_START=66 /DNA_END=380 /DNA_ORIENTATION=+
MAARNAGSLLTLALLACAAYSLLPGAFVVPATAGSSRAADTSPSALAKGFQVETRSSNIAAAAGENAQPGKINLLFLAVLVGTAVIGLIALFAYGAYSGSGSAI